MTRENVIQSQTVDIDDEQTDGFLDEIRMS